MLTEQSFFEFAGIPHMIHRQTRTQSQMHDIPTPHPLNQLPDSDFCQTQTKGIAHPFFIGSPSP